MYSLASVEAAIWLKQGKDQARCQSSVTSWAEKIFGGTDKIFRQIRK